ncbi:MAG: phosphatidate cytidylyltransferase [Flavobacteriales bacterium]|nr:phosphatidate cytidylyltransferase [Flavobacteriales bacterium]
MNQTLKRAFSGAIYVAIMWFGTSYSDLSRTILFSLITIISTYEMWKLRKGKKITFHFFYVWTLMLVLLLEVEIILFIFILTWTFDTFAYLVGVKLGKHKIMPSVSPKKSWEGFVGGFIFTLIAAYLSHSYFGFSSLRDPLIISAILPFTATLGDFIESHFKREAGVKDSGNFIPGHGGMLDRMDAFMITIPAIYLLKNLL